MLTLDQEHTVMVEGTAVGEWQNVLGLGGKIFWEDCMAKYLGGWHGKIFWGWDGKRLMGGVANFLG